VAERTVRHRLAGGMERHRRRSACTAPPTSGRSIALPARRSRPSACWRTSRTAEI